MSISFRRWKSFSIYIFVLSCVISKTDGYAETKTNLDILEQLYLSLFGESLPAFTEDDSLCVIERPESAIDYVWLIEEQLYKSLREAGVRKIYSNTTIDNAMRVSYFPVSMTILYNEFKKKRFERTIQIQIKWHITNSQDQILSSDMLEKTFQDTVVTKIKDIENIHYPFTSGTRKKSVLGALFEPAFVTLLTGLVIYLFYSYRSQ